MDFNVRIGNTLVGYATADEVRQAFREKPSGKQAQYNLVFGETQDAYSRFDDQLKIADNAFRQFRNMQIQQGVDAKDFTEAKQTLRNRLKALENELNWYLAGEYGVKPTASSGRKTKVEDVSYEYWLKSHQPFHWFVEFYKIMHGGGFDVIIGNPPYVEYKDIRSAYEVRNFKTESCSNLFAFVLERCTTLSRPNAGVGMIVPLSAFSTDRMIPLIAHLKDNSGRLKVANFSWRPGKLFDGANLQLSIVLQRVDSQLERIETTRYLMWDSETRKDLFSKIEYASTSDNRLSGSIPKLGSGAAVSILAKLRQQKREIGGCFTRNSNNRVFYRRGGLYWKVFVDFETGSSEEKIIHLLPEINKYSIIAALSSDLWWWYFTITSDCRHLGNRDIETFPFDPREISPQCLYTLCSLGKDYVKDIRRKAENAIRVYKGKKAVECLSFKVNQSKSIIDKIDHVLAKHYGLTSEELDFIINYDIKYRMGQEGGNEEE